MKYALLVFITMLACCAKTKAYTHQRSVLIIGDSISEGYFAALQQRATGFAFQHNVNVGDKALPTNAQDTRWGRSHIKIWLDHAGKVDLVTMNQGLWDINIPMTPEAEYKDNLKYIAGEILHRGIPLIFFTSTYVPPLSARYGHVEAYNQWATEAMAEVSVPVYDLFGWSVTNRALLRDPNSGDSHWSPEGYSELSDFVLLSVRDFLKL